MNKQIQLTETIKGRFAVDEYGPEKKFVSWGRLYVLGYSKHPYGDSIYV